jgi:hypothetical protein
VIFNKLLMFNTAIFVMIKTPLFSSFNTNVLNYKTLVDFYFFKCLMYLYYYFSSKAKEIINVGIIF